MLFMLMTNRETGGKRHLVGQETDEPAKQGTGILDRHFAVSVAVQRAVELCANHVPVYLNETLVNPVLGFGYHSGRHRLSRVFGPTVGHTISAM